MEQKNIARFIPRVAADSMVTKLINKNGESNKPLIEKGVKQVAALWTEKDGTIKDFEDFCLKNYISSKEMKEKMFQRISPNFETYSATLTGSALT